MSIELIRKTKEYIDYIEKHYNNVQKAWEILKEKCKDMRFIYDDYTYESIDFAVKSHDQSKLSSAEFTAYRKQFYPIDDKEKMENKKDFYAAWEHHKKVNPHHWQNWTTIPDGDPYEKEIHCVHMVIDWMAMGMRFGDTAKSYYENNKNEIDIPEWAVDFIYKIFDRTEKITNEYN